MTFSLLLAHAQSLVEDARRDATPWKRIALLCEARILLLRAVEVAALYELASTCEAGARGIPAFELRHLDTFHVSLSTWFFDR